MIVQGPGHHNASVDPDDLQRLAKVKTDVMRRAFVYKKYAAVLKRLGAQHIPGDLEDSVELLVDFRDELSHFKAQWSGAILNAKANTPEEKIARLIKRLDKLGLSEAVPV